MNGRIECYTLASHAWMNVRINEARHQTSPIQVHQVLGLAEPELGVLHLAHMKDGVVLGYETLSVLRSVALHGKDISIVIDGNHGNNNYY